MQRERTAQIDWDYFWSNVQVNGPDECWPWTGPLLARGYGRYRRTLPDGSRPSITASRLAFEAVNGPLAPGLNACHQCDNPPCCNPRHLFAGTDLDNAIDKSAKGRVRPMRGALGGNAKLTDAQVAAIRNEYRTGGATQAELGAKYGVGQSMVSSIVRGVTWTHLEVPPLTAVCGYDGCGREFAPRRHGQKYCCTAHNAAAFRSRQEGSSMYPHEFALLHRLNIEGPLAAVELAESVNRGAPIYAQRNASQIANQIRSLKVRGLVEDDGGKPRIYRLTYRGLEYTDA